MRAEVVAITGIYFFFLSFSPCSGRAGESEQNSSRTKLTSLHKSLLVPGLFTVFLVVDIEPAGCSNEQMMAAIDSCKVNRMIINTITMALAAATISR